MAHKRTATAEIRKQLQRLQAELDQVTDDRRKTELAIEDSRAKTHELLQLHSQMAAKEGNLRKQIGELETALKGLKR